MIYSHTDDELYVNLFIPSKLNWKDKRTEIVQINNYPYEAKTEIKVNPRRRTSFTLKLRYPEWSEEGTVKVKVNGKEHPATNKDGYISIDRKWRKGDSVIMEMPMSIKVEQMPDNSNYYSFSYGPIENE